MIPLGCTDLKETQSLGKQVSAPSLARITRVAVPNAGGQDEWLSATRAPRNACIRGLWFADSPSRTCRLLAAGNPARGPRLHQRGRFSSDKSPACKLAATLPPDLLAGAAGVRLRPGRTAERVLGRTHT